MAKGAFGLLANLNNPPLKSSQTFECQNGKGKREKVRESFEF